MAWPFTSVGAPNKDSGFALVPSDVAVSPANFDTISTFWLLGLYFANDTDADENVVVTDGAGNIVVPHTRVPARSVLPITNIEFMPIVGLQWLSTGGITGKVWGYA